ncbi:hypothetical protein NIES267_36680 [Calothrix parasitica NIES-267]|uniref:DUF1778 domain-containing protein n=1 Tax=Calothrix parasitica NIES-267 TaxID=1973488 RepID=A0A1Z4LSF3_9CYAN|nr:hypothetical protein NIES267_36680 [Calothrix parasitica NIES-267]
MKDKNKETNTNDLDSQKIILTDNDRDIFLSLIENSPEPNHTLKSAMKIFQEEYEK